MLENWSLTRARASICPDTNETHRLNEAMTHRLFEGREHAASYCKYRIAPPNQLIQKALDFLEKGVSRGVTVQKADSCRESDPTLHAPHTHLALVLSAGTTLPAGRRRRLWLRPGDGAAGSALCLGGGDGRQSRPAGYG